MIGTSSYSGVRSSAFGVLTRDRQIADTLARDYPDGMLAAAIDIAERAVAAGEAQDGIDWPRGILCLMAARTLRAELEEDGELTVSDSSPWAPSPIALSDKQVARLRDLAIRSTALADQVEGLLEEVDGPYRESSAIVNATCTHGKHATTDEFLACEAERLRIYTEAGAQSIVDAWVRIDDASSYFTR